MAAYETLVSKLKRSVRRFIVLALGLASTTIAGAQTGIQGGLAAATTQVKSASSYVGPLILAIGGLVGLVGGLRVFSKWNSSGNRGEVNSDIMAWGGSCVFLLLVGTVLTAFFG